MSMREHNSHMLKYLLSFVVLIACIAIILAMWRHTTVQEEDADAWRWHRTSGGPVIMTDLLAADHVHEVRAAKRSEAMRLLSTEYWVCLTAAEANTLAGETLPKVPMGRKPYLVRSVQGEPGTGRFYVGHCDDTGNFATSFVSTVPTGMEKLRRVPLIVFLEKPPVDMFVGIESEGVRGS